MHLVVDVGGWSIKRGWVNSNGPLTSEITEVRTPLPFTPEALVNQISSWTGPDTRGVVVGLPGYVRRGRTLDAPPLSRQSYGAPIDTRVAEAWSEAPLAETLAQRLRVPAMVLNDADLHALGAPTSSDFSLAIILGTGVGTALLDGNCILPHLELSHFPWNSTQTLSDFLGNAERIRIGNASWSQRVAQALPILYEITRFDSLVLGGGATNSLDSRVLNGYRTRRIPNDGFLWGAARLICAEQTGTNRRWSKAYAEGKGSDQ